VIDDVKSQDGGVARNDTQDRSIGFNLGYTINLNLPATSDPAVFDAIFQELKGSFVERRRCLVGRMGSFERLG
jgi:hypothetical protein